MLKTNLFTSALEHPAKDAVPAGYESWRGALSFNDSAILAASKVERETAFPYDIGEFT